MTDIVRGQRTLQHCRTQPDATRWQGHITPEHPEDDHWREKVWAGPTIEETVRDMAKDLGEVPDSELVITE